jgi:hypothetical protein
VEIKEFDISKPFKPFTQLLSVLPSHSSNLLPKIYSELMLSEDSKIKSFYPVEFKVDYTNVNKEYKGVIILPFIDEVLLNDAIAGLDEKLTENEKKRNSVGPTYLFFHSKLNESLVTKFSNLTNNKLPVYQNENENGIFIINPKIIENQNNIITPFQNSDFKAHYSNFKNLFCITFLIELPEFKHLSKLLKGSFIFYLGVTKLKIEIPDENILNFNFSPKGKNVSPFFNFNTPNSTNNDKFDEINILKNRISDLEEKLEKSENDKKILNNRLNNIEISIIQLQNSNNTLKNTINRNKEKYNTQINLLIQNLNPSSNN